MFYRCDAGLVKAWAMVGSHASLSERLARSCVRDTATKIVNGVHCLKCTLATSHGYPIIGTDDGRTRQAQRVAWELHTKTTLPLSVWVLHACDNRACVEFLHLFLGDNAANVADMVAKRRHQHGEKHSNAKLTAAQAHAIYHDPRPQQEIAHTYGRARTTISSIKIGKSWRYATGHTGSQK